MNLVHKQNAIVHRQCEAIYSFMSGHPTHLNLFANINSGFKFILQNADGYAALSSLAELSQRLVLQTHLAGTTITRSHSAITIFNVHTRVYPLTSSPSSKSAQDVAYCVGFRNLSSCSNSPSYILSRIDPKRPKSKVKAKKPLGS